MLDQWWDALVLVCAVVGAFALWALATGAVASVLLRRRQRRALCRAIDPDRFKQLPERVRLEDTIATHEARPVPDPSAGRDTERDFMLRNAGT